MISDNLYRGENGYVESLPSCINCGGTAIHEACDDHWYSNEDRMAAVIEELEERLVALERGRPAPIKKDGKPFRNERKTKERRKGGTPGL